MTKQKGNDYSTLLIWSAAVVTVVRYAAAFIASDLGEITGKLSEVITILIGFSGLGMGILDVIGGTYLFDGWRRTMPATGKSWGFRFKVLTIFIFALIISGVMILVPFTVSRVTHESMSSVLGDNDRLWWWALLVNLTPYLLVGGVAIGNQVVNVTIREPEKVSESEEKVTGKFPNDWRKVLPYLSNEEILSIAGSKTSEIVKKYHLNTDRTALNWRKNAQAEVALRGLRVPAGQGTG
jgi:hypothetical protein